MLQAVVPPLVKSRRNELRFTAPRRRTDVRHELPQVECDWRREMKLRRPFTTAQPSLMEKRGDILANVQQLELRTLTDEEAAYLTSPDAPHAHIADEVMDALFANLRTAPQRCAWNVPAARPEWRDEFRLVGEWWLSLRVLPCTRNLKEYHPPLIPFGLRNTESENQFIADLALHMSRTRAAFSLFHLDHITITPDRASVLLSDGILKNEARNLECISFSFCEIGAATLLLLLCGFNQCHSLQPQLRNLNLAYNWIDASCSNMMAMLLARTPIRRLCLRGNRFGGGDTIAFEDFLIHGCSLLEELDLSYTALTRGEICVLIRCLPQLRNLEVLLLDGVEIPSSRAVALSAAIRKSCLIHVSLRGISACSNEAYLKRIRNACQRNRASRDMLREHSTMRFLAETGSFFEAFTRRTCAWLSEDETVLPVTYRPFVTNEPSLPITKEV